jgi:hypothetical protein
LVDWIVWRRRVVVDEPDRENGVVAGSAGGAREEMEKN